MRSIITIIIVVALAVGAYLLSAERATRNENPQSPSTTRSNGDMRTVSLYYYDPEQDQGQGGAQCSRQGLVAITREIPLTLTPIQDAVRLLLRGELTEQERAQGITTEFPLEGVELVGASLIGNDLTLTFADPQNKTSGGACRVGILWAQIEATAAQFSEVERVRFLPEELFQP